MKDFSDFPGLSEAETRAVARKAKEAVEEEGRGGRGDDFAFIAAYADILSTEKLRKYHEWVQG